MLENDGTSSFRGVFNLENRLIFEDGPNYDFKTIVERLEDALEWIAVISKMREESDAQYFREGNAMLQVTEEFTEEAIPTPFKKLMEEGFDKYTALQIIFPQSKLSYRNNFSFPDLYCSEVNKGRKLVHICGHPMLMNLFNFCDL